MQVDTHADGFTPLHIAAQRGHTEVVKLLVYHISNVNARAHNGEMPVDAARRNRHWDIVELLK